MPLCKLTLTRIIPKDRKAYSYGHFVIDTSARGHDEILTLLSAGEIRRIGVELGMIPDLNSSMPPNMLYELNAFAVSPLDLPARPTFTSESGHCIWVIGEARERPYEAIQSGI